MSFVAIKPVYVFFYSDYYVIIFFFLPLLLLTSPRHDFHVLGPLLFFVNTPPPPPPSFLQTSVAIMVKLAEGLSSKEIMQLSLLPGSHSFTHQQAIELRLSFLLSCVSRVATSNSLDEEMAEALWHHMYTSKEDICVLDEEKEHILRTSLFLFPLSLSPSHSHLRFFH